MLSVQATSNKPKRNTLKNSLQVLKSGDEQELKKILRRRLLNTLKLVKRAVFFIPLAIYNQPTIKRRRETRRLRNVLAEIYGVIDTPSDQRKTIALIVRDGTNYPKSSAFIRLIGPLTQEIISKKYRLAILPENTTSLPDNVSVCIVQRTAYDTVDAAEQLVQETKNRHCRLLIDSDDAFTVIDSSHPEHKEQRERVAAFEFLLKSADSVWLSTRTLVDVYPKTSSKPIVIQNYLDNRLWDVEHPVKHNQGALHLLYMGTATHDADLQMILPALQKLHDTHPGSFKLSVVGVSSTLPDAPWLQRLQPNKTSLYPLFVQWFVRQGPFDIGLSPLVDNAFNRCKSDIKCLDYFAVGALPVVSDIAPYTSKELSGMIMKVANDGDAWYQTLVQLVDNPTATRQQIQENRDKSRAYLWTKRSSTQAAKELLSLLEA